MDLASTVDPEHDYHGQGITLFDPPDERKKHRLFSVERTYAQLSDKNGNVLGRSPTLTGTKKLPYSKEDYVSAIASGVSYRNVNRIDFSEGEDAGKPYRLITYAIKGKNKIPYSYKSRLL